MKFGVLLCGGLALFACAGAASPGTVVEGFEPERYLGKWYEIARLDHWFERGLIRTTAEYTLREGGGLTVLNRGYDPRKGRWKEARGIARFTDGPSVASLKVSFFRPFWGSYRVIALDREGYRYALVAGANRKYLWLLSRTPVLDRPTLDRLLAQAREAGFDTGKLIWVEQEQAR